MYEEENKKEVEEVSLDISEDDEVEIVEAEDSQSEDVRKVEDPKEEDLHLKYQRLQAEFDNYRKRMESRFSEMAKHATEGIIIKLLEINDNIQRALTVDFAADPEGAKKGIAAIEQQVTKILGQENVRAFESLGKPFDPYYHNAINRKHDPESSDGIVLEEYQRGYMIRERVLRPALVCVNRHEVVSDEDVTDNDDNEKE